MSMDQEQKEPISTPVAGQPALVRAGSIWMRLLNAVGILLVLGGLFAFCLWFYTRNNTFPMEFHPDESGKVAQVTSEYRNFNHPQLMLEATQIWLRWLPVTTDPLEIAVAGRQVSAFFGAAAAALLAFTAYLAAGWWGLLFGSLILGLCPSLLTYSHYMKEDASLVFGVAVAILASRLVWRAQRWWTRLPAWVLLAAGCALSASGKYVGVAAIILPFLLLFAGPRLRWYKPPLRLLLVLLFVVPLAVVFTGIINHRILANDFGMPLVKQVIAEPRQWPSLLSRSFVNGFEREREHANTQHWGLTARQPNTYIVRTAFADSWPQVAIAVCAFPLAILLTRRRGWGWELALLLFAASFTLVLSFSVIIFDRYALPIVVTMHLMAAIAVARLLQGMPNRPVARATLALVALAAFTAGLLPTCIDYTWQFTHDSRFELQHWAMTALPQNARVFCDSYSELDSPYGPASLFRVNRPDVMVQSSQFVPAMGDLDTFSRYYDECYLVICDLAYSRFYEPSAIPARGNELSSQRYKAIYSSLLDGQTPIWESVPKRNMNAFTNPVIKVYRVKRK
jgi:hypothetical protein